MTVLEFMVRYIFQSSKKINFLAMRKIIFKGNISHHDLVPEVQIVHHRQLKSLNSTRAKGLKQVARLEFP